MKAEPESLIQELTVRINNLHRVVTKLKLPTDAKHVHKTDN